MKKLLLGLFITLMMTGSGFAKDLDNEHCNWPYDQERD